MGKTEAEGKASRVREIKNPVAHVNFEMPKEEGHQSTRETKDELTASETYTYKAQTRKAKLTE